MPSSNKILEKPNNRFKENLKSVDFGYNYYLKIQNSDLHPFINVCHHV